MTIRVVVADDQSLIRGGFAMMLSAAEDIEVVGQAATGDEAIAVSRASHPNVILMDIRMPGTDGLEATAQILQSATWPVRVLILTTFDPDEYVYRALRAGASGFVLKDIRPEELPEAVRTVATGGALLAPAITRRLIGRFADQLAGNPTLTVQRERLTEREQDVVRAVARGLTNAQISAELFIGAATVKSHMSSILAKLGLRDRAQVVVFAYESGLVQVGVQDRGT